MPNIRCKHYTDSGESKPGQQCPHATCAHVHPSDSNWPEALPYSEEVARKIAQENRDRDAATASKFAPVKPAGQLFVDPRDPPQPYDVTAAPVGSDRKQRTQSPTGSGWNTGDQQNGWGPSDAGNGDTEVSGWGGGEDGQSGAWGAEPPVQDQDVEMTEPHTSACWSPGPVKPSTSGHNAWNQPNLPGPEPHSDAAPISASFTPDVAWPDEPAAKKLDASAVEGTQQLSNVASVDNIEALIQRTLSFQAHYAAKAAQAPSAFLQFNLARRLRAKATTLASVTHSDAFRYASEHGQMCSEHVLEVLSQYEQLQDRDRRISENEDTIRELKARVAQLYTSQKELAASSRERIAEDGMVLLLGEESTKDNSDLRTDAFGTRDERLLSAISTSLQQAVSDCAAPAVNESLADTEKLLEQLQWAISADIPAVQAAKQLLVTESQIDALFRTTFEVEPLCTAAYTDTDLRLVT